LGLLLGNSNQPQRIARFPGIGGADQLDDVAEVVERLPESEQQVLAVAGLAQQELGATADDFDAVIDEALDAIDEAELARLPVDDRQHDDPEADLQLRVLVQIIQDHLRLLAPLELEDDAHAVAVALVADSRCLRSSFVDQTHVLISGLVDLIRLGHDDRFAVFAELSRSNLARIFSGRDRWRFVDASRPG
jgi:hypothetical protein